VPLGCFTHRARGFDGGKRVKGRKRHVLVDSMGLLLAVVVTAANIADRQGLPPLLRRLQFRRGWFHRLRLIWGDRGYWLHLLFEWSWSSSTACWRYWSSPEAMVSEWFPGVG
jgi:transposase